MRYDYIIVGAGSSGAALAARLSEDPDTTVLLLEAGPDYRSAEQPDEMRAPNPFGIIGLPELSRFRYDGLRARRSAAQEPRLYWRGRGMGGSSAINGQIAIRAMLEDFDIWAEAGCDGWSGAEVLPALIRLEDDVDFGDAPYHGRGGPIPVHRAPLEKWGAVDKALRTAALDEGYGWADDCNAPGSTGVSPFPIDSRDGERVSTNDGYLEPARGRANLTIRGDVTVDRVCMQDQTATGLHGLGPNGWEEFHAREVIVACGTVHSPGMLIRSGIGPEAMVRAIGVQPIADLPVGRNFIDHSSIWIGIDLKPGARWTDVRDRHTNCCVRYSSGMAGAGRNDLFMASMNVAGWDEEGLRKGVVVAATYQTFSRGELRVVSRDARVDPEIDINMLSDERDLVRLREGYKRIHRILRHPAFTAIAERIRGRVTGEDLGEMPDDDAIDRLLLAEAEDTQHPVGSCRMGRSDDPRSVVDPDCRVIGVEGLRVIDASVMPEHVRANTHLTTVMIAEHMAARMRAD